jgi:hypothetical protein
MSCDNKELIKACAGWRLMQLAQPLARTFSILNISDGFRSFNYNRHKNKKSGIFEKLVEPYIAIIAVIRSSPRLQFNLRGYS